MLDFKNKYYYKNTLNSLYDEQLEMILGEDIDPDDFDEKLRKELVQRITDAGKKYLEEVNKFIQENLKEK